MSDTLPKVMLNISILLIFRISEFFVDFSRTNWQKMLKFGKQVKIRSRNAVFNEFRIPPEVTPVIRFFNFWNLHFCLFHGNY